VENTKVEIKGMPTAAARKLQRGGLDNNGQLPEVKTSNGVGNPCRHCLKLIATGEDFLVFSHKPFSTTQPYAEQGPIFLHAYECDAYHPDDGLPEVLKDNPEFIVRGYNNVEEIAYGTGKVVPFEEIETYAGNLLAKSEIHFVHVRSSTNNCYQARIESA